MYQSNYQFSVRSIDHVPVLLVLMAVIVTVLFTLVTVTVTTSVTVSVSSSSSVTVSVIMEQEESDQVDAESGGSNDEDQLRLFDGFRSEKFLEKNRIWILSLLFRMFSAKCTTNLMSFSKSI